MDPTDRLVDDFVFTINHGFREPKPATSVPEALRGREIDGLYDWHIAPLDAAPWVAELEVALGVPLPPVFRSLISRYQFPCFDLGPIAVFANTADGAIHELRTAVLDHSPVTSFLLGKRLLQLGFPVDWARDPVCFDLASPLPTGEGRIVRVDQQAARHGEVQVQIEMAPSLAHLIGRLVG